MGRNIKRGDFVNYHYSKEDIFPALVLGFRSNNKVLIRYSYKDLEEVSRTTEESVVNYHEITEMLLPA